MATYISLLFHGIRKHECHAVTISENAPFTQVNEFLSAQPGYYMFEQWGMAKIRYYFTEPNVAFEFKMRFA